MGPSHEQVVPGKPWTMLCNTPASGKRLIQQPTSYPDASQAVRSQNRSEARCVIFSSFRQAQSDYALRNQVEMHPYCTFTKARTPQQSTDSSGDKHGPALLSMLSTKAIVLLLHHSNGCQSHSSFDAAASSREVSPLQHRTHRQSGTGTEQPAGRTQPRSLYEV